MSGVNELLEVDGLDDVAVGADRVNGRFQADEQTKSY